MHTYFRVTAWLAGAGLAGSIYGVVDHDAAIAWTAAGVAVVSFVFTAALKGYHTLRVAVRDERLEDIKTELEHQNVIATLREHARQEHAKDLAAGLATTQRQTAADAADLRDLMGNMKERLEAVMAQRDHLSMRNDELFEQIRALMNHQFKIDEKLERARCPLTKSDGTAKCQEPLDAEHGIAGEAPG